MDYIFLILCVFTCYKVAEDKNRNASVWAVLGILFGILALIAILLLPKIDKTEY